MAVMLFHKALIRGGAAHDLFASPVQVKAHVRHGQLIAPYTAMRKKAPEPRQTLLLLQPPEPKPPLVIVKHDVVTAHPAHDARGQLARTWASVAELSDAIGKRYRAAIGHAEEAARAKEPGRGAWFGRGATTWTKRQEVWYQVALKERIAGERDSLAALLSKYDRVRGQAEQQSAALKVNEPPPHESSDVAEVRALLNPPPPSLMVKLPSDADRKRRTDQAKKLREAAAKIIADADESMNRDRQANTRRRVQQAASAIGDAQRAGQIGATMRNLADAIESGEAKALAGITSRAAVEELEGQLSNARTARWRAEASGLPTGQSHKRWETIHQTPPDSDDIRHAKLPVPALHAHQARDLVEAADVLGVKGHRPIREWLARLKGDDSASPTVEQMDRLKELIVALEPKVKAHRDDYKSHYTLRNAASSGAWASKAVRELITKRNRFVKLGINNDADLVAALGEFIAFRGGRKAENPITALERGLVGGKHGIDFFPTPAPLVSRMVALAGVQAGQRVLEPSAGKGDIADQLKAAGANVDALEISDTLRAIIEAKGHTLVGRDFNEYAPGQVYDRIVMNPPWSGNADIMHVRRAYAMLKPGGRLVALISPHSTFASDKPSVLFRAWMEEMGGTSEKHTVDEFKSQWMPQGIASVLITVDKPER